MTGNELGTLALPVVFPVLAGTGHRCQRSGSGAWFCPCGAVGRHPRFGVAALLFLATEELVVEGHEVVDTPLPAAMSFVGFFAVYVLDASR